MLLQEFCRGGRVLVAGDVYDHRYRRSSAGRRKRRETERLVLGQDHPLERPKLDRWLEPELIDERAPDLLECIESVALTSSPIEREHLEIAQSFSVGVTTDERLDRGQDRRVLPELEHRFEPQLLGDQPELVEPRALNSREGLICHIRQGWAAPKRKCFCKGGGTLPRPEPGSR
jgi:hypothetical protein